MDIVPGDRLALLPTSYDNMASDDVFVSSYDNETGITILDRGLDYSFKKIISNITNSNF